MSMVTETSGLFSSIIGSKGKKGKHGSNLFASLFSGSGSANLAGSTTNGKNLRIKVDGLGASQTAATDNTGRLFKQKGKRTQLLQHLSEKLELKPGDLAGLKAEDLDPETLKKLNALINRLKHAAADKAPGQGAMVHGVLNPSGELNLEAMLKKLSEVVGALDAKKTTAAEASDAGALAAMQLFFKDPKTGEMIELKGEKGKEILAGLLAKDGKEAAKSLFVKDPQSGGFTSLQDLPQKFKQALIEAKPQLAALFNPEAEAETETEVDAALDPKAAAKKAKAKTGDASHQKTTSDPKEKTIGQGGDQAKAATTDPTKAAKATVHLDGKAQTKVTVTTPSAEGDQTSITAIPVNKGAEGPLLDLDQIVAKIGRTKIKAARTAGSKGENQAGPTAKTPGSGETDTAGKSGKISIKSAETEGIPSSRNTGQQTSRATAVKAASHPFGGTSLDPMEQLLAKEPGLFDKVDLKGMMREFKVQKADSKPASDVPVTYDAAKLKARVNADQESPKSGVKVPKVQAETKNPKATVARESSPLHNAAHEQIARPQTAEVTKAQARPSHGEVQQSAKDAAPKPPTQTTQAKHADQIPTKAAEQHAGAEKAEKADEPTKLTQKPTSTAPKGQDAPKAAQPSTPHVTHQATKTTVESQTHRADRTAEVRQEPTQTRISDQPKKGTADKDTGSRDQRRDMPAKSQAATSPTRADRAEEAKSQTFAPSVEAKTSEETQTQNARSGLRSKPTGAGRAAERTTPTHMTATEKAALDRPTGTTEPAAKMDSAGEETNKGRVESMLKRPVNVTAKAAQPTRGPQQSAVQNEAPRADVPAQAAEVKTEAAVKPMARPTQAPPQPMFRQVQDGVYQAWQVRPNQVSIKLSPDELGELKIEVSQEQDQIKAKIQTESHKVTAIIKEHQSELEHRLREQGVEFKSFDVYEQAGQGQHENARREAPGERAEHARSGDRTTGGGSEEGTETADSAPVQDYTVEAGRPISFTV